MSDQQPTPEQRLATFLENLARLCRAHDVVLEPDDPWCPTIVKDASTNDDLGTFTNVPAGR